MKNMKRVLALVLATVMVVAMAGCGSKPAETTSDGGAEGGDVTQGTTEFKFITSMSDADRTDIFDGVVEQLQEKYPNVTFTNDSGEEYNNKARLEFSSGGGYAMVLTDDLGLTALREAGYLKEISAEVAERGWVDKQLEGATDFYNQRTPGEEYTVGLNYAPIVVYYNKTIFEELGLEEPKTIGEYENILKVATEAGYIGAENCKDNINGWYIQSFVQNKAPFEDILKWYYLEDSPASIGTAFQESSEIVKKWSDAGYFRKDYEGIDYGDVPTLFGQGQTAMSLDGNWFLYDYENTGLDVGVFAFPGVEEASTDNYIINPVDAAFAIGAQVDETQHAVAVDFIDLMLSPEVAEKWLPLGSIPSLKHEFSDDAASPLTQDLLEAIQGTHSGFYLDNVKPGFLEIFIKEMQLFLAGDQAATDMWNRIDEFWHE